MNITIEPHTTELALRSGETKTVTYPQSRIRVDGLVAGYIAWHDGARPCLIRRFSPADSAAIELEVTKLVGLRKSGPVSMPADVPPELLKPQHEAEGIRPDEFD